MKRDDLTIIGIMCGTSKDGIDIILGTTDGIKPVKTIAFKTLTFPPIFPLSLRAAEYSLQQTKGDMIVAKAEFTKYLNEYLGNASVLLFILNCHVKLITVYK